MLLGVISSGRSNYEWSEGQNELMYNSNKVGRRWMGEKQVVAQMLIFVSLAKPKASGS